MGLKTWLKSGKNRPESSENPPFPCLSSNQTIAAALMKPPRFGSLLAMLAKPVAIRNL